MAKKRSRRNDLLLICGLVVLPVIFFARSFIPIPRLALLPEGSQNQTLYNSFPEKYFLSQELKANKLPFWNPFHAGGFPDLAEGQIGTFLWFNLVAFRFLPPLIAYNLGFIYIFSQTAIGMYLLSRRKKLMPTTSFFVSIIYSFSAFFVLHTSDYSLLQTASFFPLTIFALDLLLEKASLKRILFLSVVLSQQLFAGSVQILLISLVGLLVYLFYAMFVKKTAGLILFSLGMAVVLSIVLSAVQVIPTFEYYKSSIAPDSSAEVNQFTFPPKYLLSFLHPFFLGNPNLEQTTSTIYDQFIFFENTVYIGILPLIFLGIALLVRKRISHFWLYFLFIVIGFVAMQGAKGPLNFVFSLPPFSYFGFSPRFLLLFLFGIALLSGNGFEILMQKFPYKMRSIIILVCLILATTNIFLIWSHIYTFIDMKQILATPKFVADIRSIGENSLYTEEKNAENLLPKGSPIDSFLMEKYRLLPDLPMFYNLKSINSFRNPLLPKRMYLQNQLIENNDSATNSGILSQLKKSLLSIRGVNSIITSSEIKDNDFLLKDTIQIGKNFLYLYQNLVSAPSSYLISTSYKVDTYTDVTTYLKSSSFDPRKTVLIEKNENKKDFTSTISAEIKPIKSDTDMALFQTEAQTGAYLVTTNSYYPGWRALVDTKKVDVTPVDFTNVGIFVPAGKHIVKLWYIPNFFQLGIFISSVSYVLVFSYFLWSLVNKRKKAERDFYN